MCSQQIPPIDVHLSCNALPRSRDIKKYLSLDVRRRNPQFAHLVLNLFDVSDSANSNGATTEQNAFQGQLGSELAEDRRLAPSVLVASAACGNGKPFAVLTPFTPANELSFGQLKASDLTPYCQGICQAVDFVATSKQIVQTSFQRETRKAWIFAFLDGGITDPEFLEQAIRSSRTTALEHGIHIFYFGVGSDCDMTFMNKVAQPGRPPHVLKDVKNGFKRFFGWLHESLHVYNMSRRGDVIELPPFDGHQPRLFSEG